MTTRQRCGLGLMILNLGIAIIIPEFGFGDLFNIAAAFIGFLMFVT
jgi:hypothetical protein